jgi:hypothetical protein
MDPDTKEWTMMKKKHVDLVEKHSAAPSIDEAQA